MNRSDRHYETQVRYFKKPGPKNTNLVFDAARRRAQALEIKSILVPSCTGKTAIKAVELLDTETKIIVATHVTGFLRPNDQEMADEVRSELVSRGVKVLTAQHAFGGVGRGIRKKLGSYQVDEIVAHTLRLFGHGTKVAIEIALMAADAGLVRTDEDVISLGGSGSGVDTALVVRPANSADYLDLVVKEIICKPSWL